MDRQLRSLRFHWQSFGLWVGLTILGYIFAGFLHMPGAGPPIPFNLRELDLFAGMVGFIFGAVTGLVVASLQWIVLRSWSSSIRFWVLLNAVGFGLVHAFSDAGLFNPLPTSLSLLIGGLIVGLAQAISLRLPLPKMFLWEAMAATAWLLGFQMAFALEKVFNDNPLGSLFLAYGMAGLIIGSLTWIALYIMLFERATESVSQGDPVNIP